MREAASGLLREVWTDRRKLGIESDDPLDVLHIAPRTAAEKILLLQIIELPEILPAGADHGARTEVAGMLCRPEHAIYLSKKFRTLSRRFTLAHEIGHFKLHPGLALHRDRPLEGNTQNRNRRTRTESEADLFAAEFLMPQKLLTPIFEKCFLNPIEVAPGDSSLVYKLAVGAGRPVNEVERAMHDPFYAAVLVATAGSFGVRPFEPLAARFAVSPTAMAIQLLDLGLVQSASALV